MVHLQPKSTIRNVLIERIWYNKGTGKTTITHSSYDEKFNKNSSKFNL